MSNKTRNLLKLLSILLVVLVLLMHFGTIAIPALSPYTFWMLIASYGLLLISSK
ncbi:MAG: hypothetical protein OEY34_10990 [Cyclobacteriaceae bacterium]|nr:hypothetical protein [Cyclobacteriaceae bacterium]